MGKIIEIIQKTPNASVTEISLNIGISVPTVEKHLKELKKMGKLKRVGPANGGYWETIL